RPPERSGLRLAQEALDEITLRKLAGDPDVVARVRDRAALFKLWDVCQTPDFRKVSPEEHVRLVRDLFDNLTTGRRRIPDDWIARQHKQLDRPEGEIDALAQRLSSVRTLSYVAHRPDWLVDPTGWQGKLRQLEDRLSDTLHERLMARFVDRRTSALMRGLRVRHEMLAGVGGDGAVTVEGQYVGRLLGVSFEADQGASILETKALRAAAVAAVGPEIARRLGKLAAEGDEAFALNPDGVVLWRGEAVGALSGGRPFAPRVRLFGELGEAAARERAQRRLEAFLAAEAGRRLSPLRKLDAAVTEGRIKGLPRGIAYRLLEQGGVLDRALVRDEVKALSQVERRALKALGVRIGAFSLFMPGLLKPDALAFTQAFAAEAGWRPAMTGASPLPAEMPAPWRLAAHGHRAVAGLSVSVAALEDLDERLRAAPSQGGGALLEPQIWPDLGWGEAEGEAILRALGYAPTTRAAPGAAKAWRRRNPPKPKDASSPPRAASPFAALAALKTPPPRPTPAPSPARSPKRRPRRRKRATSPGTSA
ncbi:MAG: phosphonate-binding protein, partial [Phenylobacterium sp.]|nr:phosphonate-binding protein [Phenylobacterium sp.]